ncbi:MAG: hypothetical protein JW769_04600 [Parachlamydiales bacterium]|nr:hypothetical protein [Parachlamydiales bacterium]
MINAFTTLILGNPLFALATLSILAIDVLAQDRNNIILKHIKKIGAVLAFIGYGSQIFDTQGTMATCAKISVLIMSIKLFLVDAFSKTPRQNHPQALQQARHVPPDNEPQEKRSGEKLSNVVIIIPEPRPVYPIPVAYSSPVPSTDSYRPVPSTRPGNPLSNLTRKGTWHQQERSIPRSQSATGHLVRRGAW